MESIGERDLQTSEALIDTQFLKLILSTGYYWNKFATTNDCVVSTMLFFINLTSLDICIVMSYVVYM